VVYEDLQRLVASIYASGSASTPNDIPDRHILLSDIIERTNFETSAIVVM